MQKKLTITLSEEVYAGLHRIVGRRKISRFIEKMVRPKIIRKNLAEAYKEMAADEEREREALEWTEGTLKDLSHEAR